MEHNILNVRREGEFYYPIYFEEDFSELSGGLKKENLVNLKVCIVSDSNVFPLYGEQIKKSWSLWKNLYLFLFLRQESQAKILILSRSCTGH